MKTNVAVFGEALIDLIEQDNGSLMPFIGGSPFNVARSFAKQGLSCHYTSPLSHDNYGRQIKAFALTENIELAAVKTSALPTSLAIVTKDQNGLPDYCLYRRGVADLDTTLASLQSVIPNHIDLFHTGSLALVPEMVDILLPLIRSLKAKGVCISIDINIRKGVADSETAYHEAVLELMQYANFVKVSDEDLEMLGFNGEPRDNARQLLEALDNGIVVLTLGEQGAEIITDEGCILKKPVYAPQHFGDTVGAGDTFFSAFLSQLIRNGAIRYSPGHLFELPNTDNLDNALQFGLMAATINVEQEGCQPPTKQDVLDRLATL